MKPYKEIGVFRGRTLIQKRGKIGGSRNVFVKIQGEKNDLVFPTFGGVIRNPFKGDAKMFAGDLCWFKTDANGSNPDIYLLKVFEVISASGTTLNIEKDNGYRHIPFVNDVVMVAPSIAGGTGTGVKITAVEDATVTIDEVEHEVWQITTSANISSALNNGKGILVEAAAVGSNKKMLVETVNAVIDSDCDFFGTPKIVANTNLTTASGTDTEFDAVRYFYTPALGGTMYTKKMSPLPDCIKALNRSNINGWFRVDWYDMRNLPDTTYVNEAIAEVNSEIGDVDSKVDNLAPLSGAEDPTTATVGYVGQLYMQTTDGGVFMCTAITGTDEKTYTWKEITFVS